MSLNEGFWELWRHPYSEGYTLGQVTLAGLEFDIELGKEIRRRGGQIRPARDRRDRRREARAMRAVRERQLAALGYFDIGGEG